LPVAMIAAGFNEAPEQAEAFFRGYAAGWQRLHDAMMGDAALQTQFAAVLVAPRGPVQTQLPFDGGQQVGQAPPYPTVPGVQDFRQEPPVVTYPFPPQQSYPITPLGPQTPTLNGARHEVGLPLDPPGPAGTPGLTEEDLQKPLDLQVVKSLLEEAEKKHTHEGAVEPRESREMHNARVRSMTKPMDPEEIAAAAAPVVIGDVMNPPSGE